jgi:hypothetical protein
VRGAYARASATVRVVDIVRARERMWIQRLTIANKKKNEDKE